MQIRIHFILVPKFIHIPKIQLSLLLFVIYLSALMNNSSVNKAYLLLGSLSFCIFFDLLFTYLRKDRLFIPFAAIATGLIITLIVDINAKWYELAIICALAIASKNFLRPYGKHIFNPAGFGLLVGGLIFGLPVSWWGVSFQNFQNFLPFLILISPVLVSAYRMKRFVGMMTFLAVYTLISQSLGSFLDPTVLFFALVMLPEPMTSPVDFKRQAMYGGLVGILSNLLSMNTFIAGFLPDALITALLLGNLIFFKFR